MYKYLLYLLILTISFKSSLLANEGCFIAKDVQENKILIQEGTLCKKQQSPASTFKIVISLMGFDNEILTDTENPKLTYEDKYTKDLGYKPDFTQFPFNRWAGKQTPKTWMQNSTVWYSQVIMKKLGYKKFKQYIDSMQYGNRDIAGDYKKNNGLVHSWLSSSLKISAIEQINFLEQFLLKENSTISNQSRIDTQNIMYKPEYDYHGWKIYGKTGSGFQLDNKDKKDIHKPFGWFVGFIEKDGRQIVFANYIEEPNTSTDMIYLGPKSLESGLNNLLQLHNKYHKNG